MNIKQKQLLIGGLIILFVILFAGITNDKSLTIFSSTEETTCELLEEGIDYAVYKFSFVTNCPECGRGDCDSTTSSNFNNVVYTTQSTSSLPKFVEGLQENVNFEAEEVSINGLRAITNPCSAHPGSTEVSTENLKAVCSIRGSTISGGIKRAETTCTFSGTAKTNIPANIYGITDGSAIVKIYKVGSSSSSSSSSSGGGGDPDPDPIDLPIILGIGAGLGGLFLIYRRTK